MFIQALLHSFREWAEAEPSHMTPMWRAGARSQVLSVKPKKKKKGYRKELTPTRRDGSLMWSRSRFLPVQREFPSAVLQGSDWVSVEHMEASIHPFSLFETINPDSYPFIFRVQRSFPPDSLIWRKTAAIFASFILLGLMRPDLFPRRLSCFLRVHAPLSARGNRCFFLVASGFPSYFASKARWTRYHRKQIERNRFRFTHQRDARCTYRCSSPLSALPPAQSFPLLLFHQGSGPAQGSFLVKEGFPASCACSGLRRRPREGNRIQTS